MPRPDAPSIDLNALLMSTTEDLGLVDQETVGDLRAALAANNGRWFYQHVNRIALLPPHVWGEWRHVTRLHFGKSIEMGVVDKLVRAAQSKITAGVQPRNGVTVDGGDWQARLLKSPDTDRIVSCYDNAALYLENDAAWEGVVAHNELTGGYVIRKTPPDPVSTPVGAEIEDHFDTEATRWLERRGIRLTPSAIRQIVDAVAKGNTYHPVRDHLKSLAWDGTPRLDSWLIDYCGVASSDSDPNIYAMQVGAKFLISAVARVMEPGCKADHMLVLEGAQGVGKSTAGRILGGEWFSDQLSTLGTKDASMQLRGVWIMEMAELDALSRSEMSTAKKFLTDQAERFRLPYGKRVVPYPRQCVFIGTTNSDTWLKDETGGRRFWPVTCGQIDLDGLARDRDQLWAEAFHEYGLGTQWWLTDPEVIKTANEQQRARQDEDPWMQPVIDAADELFEGSRRSASIREIMVKMGVDIAKQDKTSANRVGRCLRLAGWERFRPRTGNEEREWRYRPTALR